jgi:hypothetical protein
MDLWIPGKAKKVEYHCHCGAEFSDKAKGMRHAIKCAKEHADEIAEAAERRDSSALGGPLDKEMDAWARRQIAQGKPGYRRGRAA